MKKITIILIAVAIMSSARAQVEIGPNFGFNFSQLNGTMGFWHGSTSNKFEMSGMQRLNFGIGTSIGYKENISLAPELTLSFKGASFEAPFPNVILEYYLTYIDLPLLAHIGIFDEPLSYYAIAGPTFSFLVGGMGKEIGAGAFAAREDAILDFYTNSDNQSGSSFDIGLTLGAGATYSFGPGNIVGELRYSLGFIDINSDSKNTSYKTAGKNRVLNLMFGYRFYI